MATAARFVLFPGPLPLFVPGVDGDGNPDLVTQSEIFVGLLTGDGSGYRWYLQDPIGFGSSDPCVFATDLDQDGREDLLVSRRDGQEALFLEEYRSATDLRASSP